MNRLYSLLLLLLAFSCIGKHKSNAPKVIVNPPIEHSVDVEADTLRMDIPCGQRCGIANRNFDLSSFNSHAVGGGIKISPPLGIRSGKAAKPSLVFKEFEFRYGKYWRSNGLKADILSFNFSFLH